MFVPNLLALPLDEALKHLSKYDIECEVRTLLPPRDSETDFLGKAVRKYVVRQQLLSANKLVLTVVYRY